MRGNLADLASRFHHGGRIRRGGHHIPRLLSLIGAPISGTQVRVVPHSAGFLFRHRAVVYFFIVTPYEKVKTLVRNRRPRLGPRLHRAT